MKNPILRHLFFAFIFLMANDLFAQELDAFNRDRLDMTKKGMLVLGSWAVLNIASSPILSQRFDGTRKYFYQMNGYWNTVNLAIAIFGYYGAVNGFQEGMSFGETLVEQGKIEKALLFNTALDLGYMVGGLYLIERSKSISNKPERMKGFGQSLILQGAFLFSFDLVFYIVQANHGSYLPDFIDQLTLRPGAVGVSFRF